MLRSERFARAFFVPVMVLVSRRHMQVVLVGEDSPLETRVHLQRSQTLEDVSGVADRLEVNKSLMTELCRQRMFIRCQIKNLSFFLRFMHGQRDPRPGC